MQCSPLLKKSRTIPLCASVQNASTRSACVVSVQNPQSIFQCCPSSLFKIVEPSSDETLLSKNFAWKSSCLLSFLRLLFLEYRLKRASKYDMFFLCQDTGLHGRCVVSVWKDNAEFACLFSLSNFSLNTNTKSSWNTGCCLCSKSI